MALFQLINQCIQCTHINNRPVPSVPRGAVPTGATGQGTVMECVVSNAIAGSFCVETAVFTKAVWTTMTAVWKRDFGALLVQLHSISAAQAIPAKYVDIRP